MWWRRCSGCTACDGASGLAALIFVSSGRVSYRWHGAFRDIPPAQPEPPLLQLPSLFIYLSALAIAVALGYHAAPNLTNVYLAARVVTVIAGTSAVAATYWAGKTLSNAWVGLIAAAMLCAAPIHIQHSHFATVDVPSTLFVALALGYAALILRRGNLGDYALGGAMAGLAAGTKYNAGLVFFSVIAAHFLANRANSPVRRISALAPVLIAVGAFVVAFVVSTPGAVFWTGEFLNGITYEIAHAGAGHGLVFAGTGSGFLYTLLHVLAPGLGGLAIVVWTLIAAAVAVRRRDASGLVVLAFVAPYYILVSLSNVRFARYGLPLFPAIAVLSGWLVYQIWDRPPRGRLNTVLAAAVCAALVLVPLGRGIALDRGFAGPDPRDQAAEWIFAHVPKGALIGIIDVPWFYSPPLSKMLGFGTLPQREIETVHSPYHLTIFSQCEKPGCWWSAPPKWVVISDFETDDALRLADNRSISDSDREQVNRILGELGPGQAALHAGGDFRKPPLGTRRTICATRVPLLLFMS